ncbi:hypothetical protein [Alishewanella longhuensis]
MKLTKTGKPLLLSAGLLLAFAVWQMDSTKQCAAAETHIAQSYNVAGVAGYQVTAARHSFILLIS